MPTLYAAKGGASNSNLYTVNPVTGALTSVGPIGFAVTGLAFDPSTGTLYGVTSNLSPLHPRSLITVNTATGAGTFVGSYGLGTPLGDIAFKSDGTLYGYGGASAASLYTINKATGVATLVGTGALGSGRGLAFEIDAADNGYVFPDGTNITDGFYKVSLADGSMTLIGTFQNGSGSGGNASAASFGADQAMWLVAQPSGFNSDLCTIDSDGNLTDIGDMGAQNVDALAWQGSVKPNPWFAYPDLTELFDACPVADAESCSTPFGPMISTDGASQGPSSLRMNPGTDDSWIVIPTPVSPASTVWAYMAMALYVDWGPLFAASVDPAVLTLGTTPYGGFYWTLEPTSPTTGTLTDRFGNAFAIPNQTWTSVELAYLPNGGGLNAFTETWINGVDSGVLAAGSTHAYDHVTFGDTSWGIPDDLSYYVDDFTWSLNGRIGAVPLGGAFFNGVGSGTNLDACTCTAPTPHPVDDFYTDDESRTLNVAAPGVMSNDILPTTVSLNTGCTHGSVILNSDGSFSYTPNTGYVGTDSFIYNGNGGTATVTITIAPSTARAIFASAPAYKIAG